MMCLNMDLNGKCFMCPKHCPRDAHYFVDSCVKEVEEEIPVDDLNKYGLLMQAI